MPRPAIALFLVAALGGCTGPEGAPAPSPEARREAAPIAWEKDLEAARRRAAVEKKLVLLDFFDPHCGGCRQLDRVTYTDPEVVDLVRRRFVPVLLRIGDNAALAKQYDAAFTPAILVLTPDGRAHRLSIGFLPPAEYMACVSLGRGKAFLDEGRYDDAIPALAEVADHWPATEVAPEALYWGAIAAYRRSGDAADLVAQWKRLRDAFPDSAWTRKCAFMLEGGAPASAWGEEPKGAR